MTLSAASRFLAARFASHAHHRVLDTRMLRNALRSLEALEALELITAAESEEWAARLGRLTRGPDAWPLLAEPLREQARAYVAAQGDDGWRRFESRRALEAVGALSWRDVDDGPRRPPDLVLERVIIAPPLPPAELTVTALLLFEESLQVHWSAYLPFLRPEVESARPFPAGRVELGVHDDRGTAYGPRGMHQANGPEHSFSGFQTFVPALPADAAWLEVSSAGAPIARLPLR